jgi:hypothetical protein
LELGGTPKCVGSYGCKRYVGANLYMRGYVACYG